MPVSEADPCHIAVREEVGRTTRALRVTEAQLFKLAARRVQLIANSKTPVVSWPRLTLTDAGGFVKADEARRIIVTRA